MEKIYDVAIIGSGIVGLAGAIYSSRMNLKTIVFGNERGGTLAKTHVVENYPGFISLSGIDLTEKVLEHAKQYPVEIVSQTVQKITHQKGCFKIFTNKMEISSKTVLFATGSKYKELNVKGENEYKNKGVHYCAVCDGPLYKGRESIAVVGGGDSAVKEALLLSEYVKKVYILARSSLKPEPINLERMKKNKKIESYEQIELKEIKGKEFVKEIVLSKPIRNSDILKVDAVFVEIGHLPLSDLAVSLGVKVNKNKEIIITREARTNIPRVYAAGDVADLKFKQAITGVGESVTAIYSIYEDLKNSEVQLC